MTQDASKFLARGRAIWQPCLAFLLLGAVPALLTGCSQVTDPTAADVADVEGKRLAPTDEPSPLPAGGTLSITAPDYGRWQVATGDEPVIVYAEPGLPVQFFWRAVDSLPLASELTYRYGWNVDDPDDADDPGWFGPPRTGYKAQQTQPLEIWEGVYDLTIECWDGERLLVRAQLEVWGMPVMPRALD